MRAGRPTASGMSVHCRDAASPAVALSIANTLQIVISTASPVMITSVDDSISDTLLHQTAQNSNAYVLHVSK